MKVDVDPELKIIMVTLSRSNLLALLTKLEVADSARAITKESESGWRVISQSESDDDHYMGGPRGAMHPLTEAMMLARELILEVNEYERQSLERTPDEHRKPANVVEPAHGQGVHSSPYTRY